MDPVDLAYAFKKKFPADATPAFILDLGADYKTFIPLLDGGDKTKLDTLKWRVKLLQKLPTEDPPGAEILLNEGWAALSYAWGEYLPDPKCRDIYPDDRLRDKWPLAVNDSYDVRSNRPANEYDWFIPKAPKFQSFDIKQVLLRRGKRFAWWDWACIPQQDFSKGYVADPSKGYAGPPPLAGNLQKMKGEEIGKQKYVYQHGSVGGVWLHTMDWKDQADKSPVKALLALTPPSMNSVTLDHLLQSPSYVSAQPEPLQILDQTVFKGAVKSVDIKKILEDIKALLTNIRPPVGQQMKKGDDPLPGDGWFRSLWSFQEGRLMTDPLLLDKNGQTYTLSSCKYCTTSNQLATYSHICSIPTFLASQISLTIAIFDASTRVNAQEDKVHAGLLDFVRTDRKYLVDYLRYLTASGLVMDSGESPLQLLAAARRTRFPSLSWQDNYYAMIGVLDLFGEIKMAGADSPDAYYFPVEVIQKNFFEALIARFQWKALLLAKFEKDPCSSWTAVSMGHFEPIEPYFQSFIGQTYNYKPDLSKPLPLLNYVRDTDEVIIKPARGSSKLTVWRFGEIVTPPGGKWPEPKYSTGVVTLDKTTPNTDYVLKTSEGPDDLVYLKEGWVDIDVNPKEKQMIPMLSKPIVKGTFLSFDASDKILIPFQDPGFQVNVRGGNIGTGKTSRCLVLGGVTNTNDVWRGKFLYIWDISNAPVIEVNASEVHVKWQ